MAGLHASDADAEVESLVAIRDPPAHQHRRSAELEAVIEDGHATVRAYVALGSNLGDRAQHIRDACTQMAALPTVSGMQCSALYETAPMGPQDQPDYLNAVCAFDYTGTARGLMMQLQQLERTHGRTEPGRRWGARPLDLDILLFGEQCIDEPDLRVPHIGLAQRSFVLWPLAELMPELHIPGKGPVRSLQEHCPRFGIHEYRAVRSCGGCNRLCE